MCNKPLYVNGFEVACRQCNECISTRINNWVARCRLEQKHSKHVYVLTLTYSDTSQFSYGSEFMTYAHVKGFLKRLRFSLSQKKGGGKVRYICAGELGSKKGRVHWHMILFTNRSLESCGVITDCHGNHLNFQDGTVYDKRTNWSLWTAGFVYLQRPNEGTFRYIVKYALKNMWSRKRAHGTKYETTVDNRSAGLFRQSRRPLIGYREIPSKIERLYRVGANPVTLKLQLPEGGYYYPTDRYRQLYVRGLMIMNKISLCGGRQMTNLQRLVDGLTETEQDMFFNEMEIEYEEKEKYIEPIEWKKKALRPQTAAELFPGNRTAKKDKPKEIRATTCRGFEPRFEQTGTLCTACIEDLDQSDYGRYVEYVRRYWHASPPEHEERHWAEYCQRRKNDRTQDTAMQKAT